MRFWYVFCLSIYLYTSGHDIRKQHTKFYQNPVKNLENGEQKSWLLPVFFESHFTSCMLVY